MSRRAARTPPSDAITVVVTGRDADGEIVADELAPRGGGWHEGSVPMTHAIDLTIRSHDEWGSRTAEIRPGHDGRPELVIPGRDTGPGTSAAAAPSWRAAP